MSYNLKKVLLLTTAIVALVMIVFTSHGYAANANNLNVNCEYRVNSLEPDYISGYSFDLNVPTNGRIKVCIEECNEIIYDTVWIDNGDGTRSARQLNVSGDRLDSGWISVSAGLKNMKLSTIEQGYWADNEIIFIEFEAKSDSTGDVENNDTLDNANKITFGKTVEGNFSGYTDGYSRADIDCYVVETNKSGRLDITLTNSTNAEYLIPFTVYAEDANGNYEEVMYVWDKNYLYLGYEKIYAPTEFRVRLPEGRYYLQLEVDWKESSEYNLTVNFTEESADKFEQEKNNSSRTANLKDFDTQYTGNLHSENDVDWYKFDIPTKGNITLNFWNPADIAKDKVEITVDANIPATGDNGNVNLWLEIIFMSSFILFFVKKKSYAE